MRRLSDQVDHGWTSEEEQWRLDDVGWCGARVEQRRRAWSGQERRRRNVLNSLPASAVSCIAFDHQDDSSYSFACDVRPRSSTSRRHGSTAVASTLRNDARHERSSRNDATSRWIVRSAHPSASTSADAAHGSRANPSPATSNELQKFDSTRSTSSSRTAPSYLLSTSPSRSYESRTPSRSRLLNSLRQWRRWISFRHGSEHE